MRLLDTTASGLTLDFFAINAAGLYWNGSAYVAWSTFDNTTFQAARIAATELGPGTYDGGTAPTGAVWYELRLRASTRATSIVYAAGKLALPDAAPGATGGVLTDKDGFSLAASQTFHTSGYVGSVLGGIGGSVASVVGAVNVNMAQSTGTGTNTTGSQLDAAGGSNSGDVNVTQWGGVAVGGMPNTGTVSATVAGYADGQDPATQLAIAGEDVLEIPLGATARRSFLSVDDDDAPVDFVTTDATIARNGSNTVLVPTISHAGVGRYVLSIPATGTNGFAVGDQVAFTLTGTNSAGTFTKDKEVTIVSNGTPRNITISERDISVS